MSTTLRAMKKVSEVQNKRQDLFWKMRMRAHAGVQREQIRAEIKKGIELIAPAAADREKAIRLSTQSKVTQKQKVTKASKSKMEI